MYQVELYTDGACSGNPGPAGIGIVLKSGKLRKELSLSIGETTNNVAEIMAVVEGIQLLKKPLQTEVVIYTDSQLVEGFLVKDWEPQCNQMLVEKMRIVVNQCHSFKVVKVKGHSRIPENELCHRLAQSAAKKASLKPEPEMVCF